MNQNDTNNSGGGKLTMERLKSEADAYSRSNRRNVTTPLYGSAETRVGTTPEQAFAAALEANPETYAEFRGKHNAAALVAQLRNAGFTIQAS